MKFVAVLLGMIPLASMAEINSFCASLSTQNPFPEAACSTSLALGGGTSVDCAWVFDYRSAEAALNFELLVDQVSECGVVIRQQDQQVSHPDSYDLRQFSVDGKQVSVSLKDKGGLEQSYVFVRIEER